MDGNRLQAGIRGPNRENLCFQDQKRFSKNKTIRRAKLVLKAEQADEMTLTPKRCVQIKPKVNMDIKFRFQCEKLIRGHTESLPADARFDVSMVDLTDIEDIGRYYGGIVFLSSATVLKTGK